MGVTIKDVANLAGVSTATVSYVINNTRLVAAATRAKVEQAMASLKFSPNTVARSLRVRHSRTIGMVVPEISNPSATDAIHGVEKVLRDNGYNLLICESGDDGNSEVKLIRVFASMFVDGVIITASGLQRDELRDALRAAAIPVVFLDRSLPDLDGDVVTLDNVRSTREATALLLRRGRRRIALLLGPARHSTTRDRLKGYREAHAGSGLAVDESLIRYGDFGLESGRALTGELLETVAPDAFFAASADMTLGIFQEVRARKLRIPGDVSIIGCHDSLWASATEPPLSMISQPASDLGKLCAELLLKRIRTPGVGFERIYLPAELTVRGSV